MIDQLIRHQQSFALYRLPEQPEPQLLIVAPHQVKLLSSIDDLADYSGFVMIPFAIEQAPIILLNSHTWLTGWDAIQQAILQLKLPDTSHHIRLRSAVWHETTFEDYQKIFQQFMTILTQQECQKLVLSRTKQAALPADFSYQQLFEQACQHYHNAFIYLCYTPQTGVWFGASPERFLSGEQQQWHTVALAGTQAVFGNAASLTWDAKNILEQQIVVDYIREALLKFTTQLQQSQPYSVQAGGVYHLKTDFQFTCDKQDKIIQLIKSLHPTPAVCGLPKQAAYDFVRQHERYPRDYYSGVVGCLDLERRTELYVNLRCMSQSNDKLRLFAGGGLLSDSKIESEWQETEAKLQTILSLIGTEC